MWCKTDSGTIRKTLGKALVLWMEWQQSGWRHSNPGTCLGHTATAIFPHPKKALFNTISFSSEECHCVRVRWGWVHAVGVGCVCVGVGCVRLGLGACGWGYLYLFMPLPLWRCPFPLAFIFAVPVYIPTKLIAAITTRFIIRRGRR